jgi:hypothetical protein
LVCAWSPASAQSTPQRPATSSTNPTNPANPTNLTSPTNPIECWWKTDRNAVRIGERFALTLTCAVIDTDRVKVVVDESGFAPTALHLVPFEIVEGQRFRDVLNAPRRFFQYRYTLRLLGEEFFGKEITLPTLQIGYRIQNSLQGGSALQGREAQYSLPAVPIRVLSLVPPRTTEIRDTPTDTFGDVERRLFRSNLLLMLAGVAFVLAVLMAGLAIARAAGRRRTTPAAAKRVLSGGAVLRAAASEVGAVRSASREGWTPELAGRAAAALRLAAAVALARPVGQRVAGGGESRREGEVPAALGINALTGRRIMLSASATPAMLASTDGRAASEAQEAVGRALGVFSAARYGSGSTLDEAALNAALEEGQGAVRRLRISHAARIGRPARRATPGGAKPTWAR